MSQFRVIRLSLESIEGENFTETERAKQSKAKQSKAQLRWPRAHDSSSNHHTDEFK